MGWHLAGARRQHAAAGAGLRTRPDQDQSPVGLCRRRAVYGSNTPPTVVFNYAPDRTCARPAEHLKTFRGILQVDGYAGFEALAYKALSRRRLLGARSTEIFELHEAGSPVAIEAVQRIGELHEIEATIRGQSPDERQGVRQQRSLPLVEVLQAWLDLQLLRLPGRSKLAEAICYTLGRWTAITRFLDDGRIDLDTNHCRAVDQTGRAGSQKQPDRGERGKRKTLNYRGFSGRDCQAE